MVHLPEACDFQLPPPYDSQSASDWQFDPDDEAQASVAKSYSIAYSMKVPYFLYDRDFWDYTAEERQKLPLNIRGSYKIIADLTEPGPELYATVKKFISEQRQADEDMDEMMILVYPEGANIQTPTWIVRAIWAPLGKFGNMDWHIAIENDRSNYKITYQTR
jgi:hypothetical protein